MTFQRHEISHVRRHDMENHLQGHLEEGEEPAKEPVYPESVQSDEPILVDAADMDNAHELLHAMPYLASAIWETVKEIIAKSEVDWSVHQFRGGDGEAFMVKVVITGNLSRYAENVRLVAEDKRVFFVTPAQTSFGPPSTTLGYDHGPIMDEETEREFDEDDVLRSEDLALPPGTPLGTPIDIEQSFPTSSFAVDAAEEGGDRNALHIYMPDDSVFVFVDQEEIDRMELDKVSNREALEISSDGTMRILFESLSPRAQAELRGQMQKQAAVEAGDLPEDWRTSGPHPRNDAPRFA